LQQGIDAGADVEQGLQGRLLVDELLGRGSGGRLAKQMVIFMA
jgi:hypothetical protein